MNDLDAITYFLVNSTLVLGGAAVVFGLLGVCFGWLFWGRYVRRYQRASKEVNNLKDEVVLLKRRITEVSARPARVSTRVQTVVVSRFRPPEEMIQDEAPAKPPPQMPLSQAFSIWTEDGWRPHRYRGRKLPPSQAFTLWIGKPLRSRQNSKAAATALAAKHSSVESLTALAALPAIPSFGESQMAVNEGSAEADAGMVFQAGDYLPETPSSPWLPSLPRLPLPPSVAFTVWTEAGVELVPKIAVVASRAFSVWLEEDLHPRIAVRASRAFSLWLTPDGMPQRTSNPPLRSARAFTLWTVEGWRPAVRPERGRAFTVWTESGWSAALRNGPPTRSARSFTVWTEPGWHPQPVPQRESGLRERDDMTAVPLTLSPPAPVPVAGVAPDMPPPENAKAVVTEPRAAGRSLFSRLGTVVKRALGMEGA